MYPSDKWTEQELQKLEKRLTDVYKQAEKELDGKARNYFKQFSSRYAKEYAAYQAGKYTKKEFEAWLMNQYGRGQRWEALREDMARRLTESNQIAAAYINEKTPLVIALNYNFEAYMIKSLVPDKQIKEIGDIAFNLVDEHTVKRMTVKKQKILPPRRVLKSKDVHWNKKKLQNALLQGILQGDSIKKLAGRFHDVTGMNHTAAIRNARTAFTGAQNGGRQAAYEEAYQMGIDVVKHWTATKDLRTRDSHRALDGEEVPFNMVYSNGLMYPGDPSGIPAEVYNCRCTQRTALPAELAQPRMIRVRNPETGRNEVIEDMTYYEWLATQRGANIMADIDVVSHVDEVILKTAMALARALEQAGAAAEGHAKDLCPVDTGALRNSITHRTDLENLTETIGSNEEYAAYVELGTGVYYKGGRKTPWTYQDDKGQWHITNGQRAQPYLKPAAANYAKEYTAIIADELKGAME